MDSDIWGLKTLATRDVSDPYISLVAAGNAVRLPLVYDASQWPLRLPDPQAAAGSWTANNKVWQHSPIVIYNWWDEGIQDHTRLPLMTSLQSSQ